MRRWYSENKVVIREKERLKKYGVTPAQYAELLQRQRGACAVCRGQPNGSGRASDQFHVDHDHKTGQVRGLLCSNCNTAIGLFGDDPVRLRAALKYLTR